MMSSLGVDLSTRICPEPPYGSLSTAVAEEEGTDHFERLPDSLLLLVFDKIGDVIALGRCCVVSKRFDALVPQVENVVVRLDCVTPDDYASLEESRRSVSTFFSFVFGGIVKPINALGQFLGHGGSSSNSLSSLLSDGDRVDVDAHLEQGGGVTRHSPTQVLKNFTGIRFLRIELPGGELGIEDGALLKWRADFGSTLDNCVMLGASSVVNQEDFKSNQMNHADGNWDDNQSIPGSFYSNSGLKIRMVWAISSLIAASARHCLLQPIIAEHKTLDILILSDADGQGLLYMNKEQLEELRFKPLSTSSASKGTFVPAMNMRLWCAPCLDLPDGTVLKGATLAAIRPSQQSAPKEVLDEPWVSSAFEEPHASAARMLVKTKTYCIEMNSF